MPRLSGRWLLPSVATTLVTAYLLFHALPRMEEGSESLRHVYHALHDEGVILEGTWKMVDRGGLSHGIKVYPGFYPYQVALIRAGLRDQPPRASIVATRWWSLLVMVAALWVTFLGFGRVAEAPWVGAGVAVAMALNPEMIEWTSRVHPDAWLLLLDHGAIAALFWAVDRRSPRALLAATVLASFSAATKLVGCFIMVPIGLWILFAPGPRLIERLRQGVLHLGIFIAVFVATNPLLFTHGIHLLRGLSDQHRRNRKGPGSTLEWLELLVGPNGLGWAGLFVVVIGLVLFLRRRRLGLAVIFGFAAYYLGFILFGVKIVEARYAYPAVFPLLFCALASLAEAPKRVVVATLAVASALYLGVDARAQAQVRALLATKYQREMSPEKLELGRRLAALPGTGVVYSSAAIFVPEPVEWKIIWDLDEVPVEPRARAVVIDDVLRASIGEPNATLQKLGLAPSAVVGTFVLYR